MLCFSKLVLTRQLEKVPHRLDLRDQLAHVCIVFVELLLKEIGWPTLVARRPLTSLRPHPLGRGVGIPRD
jgi:hypothetical protein